MTRIRPGGATYLRPTAVKTSAYTAAPGDLVRVDVSGGNVPITLPPATAPWQLGGKVTAAGFPVGSTGATFAPNGSDTLNGGSSSVTLRYLNEARVFVSDGSGNVVVQSGDLPKSSLDALYPAASRSRWSTAYVDVCSTWTDGTTFYAPLTPATKLAVTFTSGSNTATVTSGTAPASGALIADTAGVVPNGTTYTASGATLTLSANAGASGTSLVTYAGPDATPSLQAALNYLASQGSDGTVHLSKPGTYLVAGALQSGTAFSTAYNGQLLFPARAQSSSSSLLALRIRGHQGFAGFPGGGIQPASGAVTLLGNPGTGNFFDAVCGYTLNGYNWTAIVPTFEDVVLRCPGNPQGTVIEGTHLAGLNFRGSVLIDTLNRFTAPNQTGTGFAVKWPYNANMAQLHQSGELALDGYPNLMNTGEHLVCDYLFLQYAKVGITAGIATHLVQFSKCVMQGVQTGIKATNADAHLTGTFDIGDSSPTAFIDDVNNYLVGEIRMAAVNYTSTNGARGFQCNGGQSAALRNVWRKPMPWPIDLVKRTDTQITGQGTVTYANGPGVTDQSMHVWSPTSIGVNFPEAGGMRAAVQTTTVLRTWLQYGEGLGRANPSRIVRSKVTTGSGTYNWFQILNKVTASGTNTYITIQLDGTNNRVNIQKTVAGTGTTLASSANGSIAASTSYTLDTVISNPYSALGLYTITVYLNGTALSGATYTLLSADATALADTDPLLTRDGWGCYNDNTLLTEYRVLPAG